MNDKLQVTPKTEPYISPLARAVHAAGLAMFAGEISHAKFTLGRESFQSHRPNHMHDAHGYYEFFGQAVHDQFMKGSPPKSETIDTTYTEYHEAKECDLHKEPALLCESSGTETGSQSGRNDQQVHLVRCYKGNGRARRVQNFQIKNNS